MKVSGRVEKCTKWEKYRWQVWFDKSQKYVSPHNYPDITWAVQWYKVQIQIYKITSTGHLYAWKGSPAFYLFCAALILNHKVYGENQNCLEISAVDTGMMMMMMMVMMMMVMMMMKVDGWWAGGRWCIGGCGVVLCCIGSLHHPTHYIIVIIIFWLTGIESYGSLSTPYCSMKMMRGWRNADNEDRWSCLDPVSGIRQRGRGV